jgi:hypothetical protein
MRAHWNDDRDVLLSKTFQPDFGERSDSISPLHQAWFRVLEQCLIDHSIDTAMISLMRNCFFSGGMLAVLLLQTGHGDQLVHRIRQMIHPSPGRSLQRASASLKSGESSDWI